MLAATVGFVALALLGHAALWTGVVNRWHATGFPRPVVKGVTAVFYAALAGIPLAVVWYLADRGTASWQWQAGHAPLNWATAYLALCAAYGLVHVPLWALTRWRQRTHPPIVRAGHSRQIDLSRELGAPPTTSPRTRLFCMIPFNQLWQLEVSEYNVEIAGLPPALEGLSICHISDLHFSPRIERAYFDEVVRLTNALQPDLIALTGDVCDKARMIGWVPETLGRMHARLGKFSILGNHDLRTRDVARLRAAISAAQFVDVGGRVENVADAPLSIAGDERPWFRHRAPALDSVSDDRFKILLAHTPDQLAWARQRGFGLMLAGHTHGGQIRFPLVGPVICPSWHGTKYACGFFHEPPTLLHVSRGTASLFPYRLNCRPEITKLVLRRTV